MTTFLPELKISEKYASRRQLEQTLRQMGGNIQVYFPQYWMLTTIFLDPRDL